MMGILRSCAAAMLLNGRQTCYLNTCTLLEERQRRIDSRKTEVGNDCGLVESDAVGAHSKGSPNKRK